MRKNVIVYILLILSIAFTQFAVLQFVTVAKGSDGILYDGIAKAIFYRQTIIDQPGQIGHGEDIGAAIMPGYPALIALVYAIFGIKFHAFIIFQILLGAVACIVFYRICKNNFNQWVALGATFWLIGYIEIWRYNYQYYMDSLTASMLIFSLYFLDKYFKISRARSLYIFSILFGIIIAVNNRFILHAIFLGTYFIYLNLNDHTIKLKEIIVIGSILVIFLLPWHIRQYMQYDKIVIFSPLRTNQTIENQIIGKDQFPDFNQQYKRLAGGNASIGSPSNYLQKFTHEKYEEMKSNYNAFEGFQKYFSRLKGFFKIVRIDFQFGFGGDTRIIPPNIYGKIQILHMLFTLFFLGSMFLLMIPGIFFAFRNNNLFFISLFILFAAHVILHTFIHLDPWIRYRIPIVPVIFLLGWYGIQNIINLLPYNWIKKYNLNL